MGMIILIIFAIYILIGIFLSKLVFKIFKKKLISKLFLTFFIVFPFWDVLLQNTTAIYYQAMYPEYKIYEKAELDKDGKVDSIAFLTYAADIKKYNIDQFNKYPHAFDLINNYKEYLIKDEKGKERILKVKKIAQGKYDFKLIEKSEARYKVVTENETTSFYHRFGYLKVIDTKSNKTMAESYYLHFKNFDDSFRTNILYMVGGTGISVFKKPYKNSIKTNYLLEKIGI